MALVNIGFCEAMKRCIPHQRPDATKPIYRQGILEKFTPSHDWYHIVLASHCLEHAHNLDASFREMCRYGREICGVVAKPKDDDAGEHMRKITKEILEAYLAEYCKEFDLFVDMEFEYAFRGTPK